MHPKKRKQKKEAREQMLVFFEQAILSSNIEKGTLYIHKARNIAMKYRFYIPREYKRRFCKHCYTFLIPGRNCRVRTQSGHVVYLCQNCNKFMRFKIISVKSLPSQKKD